LYDFSRIAATSRLRVTGFPLHRSPDFPECGIAGNALGLAAAPPHQKPEASVLHYLFRVALKIRIMLLSKEYVGYLARELTKKLVAGEFIETKSLPAVTEKVHAAILEEMTLEDRINDEVRVILEAYSEEMLKTGANYQEMFRKVKSELVRKYKAVL
jgi:hypothetical protein